MQHSCSIMYVSTDPLTWIIYRRLFMYWYVVQMLQDHHMCLRNHESGSCVAIELTR